MNLLSFLFWEFGDLVYVQISHDFGVCIIFAIIAETNVVLNFKKLITATRKKEDEVLINVYLRVKGKASPLQGNIKIWHPGIFSIFWTPVSPTPLVWQLPNYRQPPPLGRLMSDHNQPSPILYTLTNRQTKENVIIIHAKL